MKKVLFVKKRSHRSDVRIKILEKFQDSTNRIRLIMNRNREYCRRINFTPLTIKLRMAPKWNALSPYRPMPRTENKKKKKRKRKRKKRKKGEKEQGRGRGVGDDDDGGGSGVARGGSDAKYNRNREKGIFWLTSSLTRIADCCSAASNKFERIFGEQQHHQEAGLYVADSCGWIIPLPYEAIKGFRVFKYKRQISDWSINNRENIQNLLN
ncbi:hypothetical protein V1477_007224 [Vespula maculifrons]|uniref:Uncharacterized protein n=1 Tax=Vespula maculifrons TaxID=7453 RepID=A0ABD2CHX8_VESMC